MENGAATTTTTTTEAGGGEEWDGGWERGDEGDGGWETGASTTGTTVGATAVGATSPGAIVTGDAAPFAGRGPTDFGGRGGRGGGGRGGRGPGHFGDWPSRPDSVVPRLPGDSFDDNDDVRAADAGAGAANASEAENRASHSKLHLRRAVAPCRHDDICEWRVSPFVVFPASRVSLIPVDARRWRVAHIPRGRITGRTTTRRIGKFGG